MTPKPLLLIENGKLIKKNLDKEFLTEDEIESQLRQQGLEDISRVRKCYLESNGHFSILIAGNGDSQPKGNESGSPAVN